MYSVGVDGKLQLDLSRVIFVLCFVWQEPEALEISHKSITRDNGVEGVDCIEESLDESISFCLGRKASNDFYKSTLVAPVVLCVEHSVSQKDRLIDVSVSGLVTTNRRLTEWMFGARSAKQVEQRTSLRRVSLGGWR